MDDDSILFAKAAQQFGLRRRCAHTHSALCQHVDAEFGWFVAYQCDDCGMVTRQDVTAAQLNIADLPYIDAALWEQAIANANRSGNLTRALVFMGRALQP